MFSVLVFLAVILLLAGCGKQEGDSYSVYYKNAAGTKLVTSQYVTDTKDGTSLINELFSQMGKSQKKDDCVSLKPENLTLEKAEIVQNVA
jgi:uncharacterized lipoprotein YehR (DUF1307 family)